MFTPEELQSRRARLVEILDLLHLELAVVTHPPDLFYLTGTCQASYLFIPRNGRAWLAARRGGEWARGETDLAVEDFRNAGELEGAIRHRLGTPRRLGLAFDTSRYDLVNRVGKAFPAAELVDLGPSLRRLRQIKSAAEVDFIRLAGRQLDGAFKTAASLLRVGMSELELAIRLEAYLRRKGHPGSMRIRQAANAATIGYVLAGVSTLPVSESDMPATGCGLTPAMPFGPSGHEFRPGEPVLFDYGGNCGGYLADIARMLSVGPPVAEAAWAFEAMRQVLRRVEKSLGPSAETGALYNLARREAVLLGYEEQFMGAGRTQLSYIGHGLGLELDEPPFVARGTNDRLAAGMVVAIEPKVTLSGIGVVGVENTYLITANGFERLTLALEDWRQVPVE